MSAPIASIAYEQPAIVRRDSVQGLLTVSKSDPKDVAQSDVNVKENIRPVSW